MVDELVVKEIKLLNGFYKYLRDHKDECVMDLMIAYCEEENIPVEALGHLVSEDKYLKDYISKNLEKFKFLRNDNIPKSELLDGF